MYLPYDPLILILGIYPREVKAYGHRKTCTWMFIATLFIVAKKLETTQIPFSNRKEWDIDAHNNMVNLQSNYTEWKKPNKST